MEIQELRSRDEWRESFPVMQELRPHLNELQYLDLLESMTKEGYRLFALRDARRIVSLAGVGVLTNLSHGRHVWVYDLITVTDARSRGYGRCLLEFVEEFARREGCWTVALSSNLQRADAHRFYEWRMGYEKPSYVFRKRLAEVPNPTEGTS
jgi:GNAT superfamily N-acetyltransferase